MYCHGAIAARVQSGEPIEKRTRKIKIWGRWMHGKPSYMTTEYNPETKSWDLIDMNIHFTLKEVKQYLCEMYPDYAFYRLKKIENDTREYWCNPREDPDSWRGFRN